LAAAWRLPRLLLRKPVLFQVAAKCPDRKDRAQSPAYKHAGHKVLVHNKLVHNKLVHNQLGHNQLVHNQLGHNQLGIISRTIASRTMTSRRISTGTIEPWSWNGAIGIANYAGARVDDDAHEDAAKVGRAENVNGAFAQGRSQRIESSCTHVPYDFIGRHEAGHGRLGDGRSACQQRKNKQKRKNDPERR
jgi:hypothetical protein